MSPNQRGAGGGDPAKAANWPWLACRSNMCFSVSGASPGTGGAMGVSDMRARVSFSGAPFNPAAMRLGDGKLAAVDCATVIARQGHGIICLAIEFERQTPDRTAQSRQGKNGGQ